MSNVTDLTGNQYGRLTVLGFSHVRNRHYYWECQCDCGETSVVDGGKLRGGYTQSCGCLLRERRIEAHTTHGEYGSPEHIVWKAMIQRCMDSNCSSYDRYGGRGISVCNRWLGGEDGKTGCECFIEDMGRRPSASHSIDRIDNEGSYSPENCHWVTAKEQARNRRSTLMVKYRGERRPLAELCDEASLPYHRVYQRIRRLGWSVEEALA